MAAVRGAGILHGQLFKILCLEGADDVLDRAGHGPEHLDALSIEHHDGPCAHAAGDHHIDSPALQRCHRIAGAVLMMAVGVFDDFEGLAFGVINGKIRRAAEVAVHLCCSFLRLFQWEYKFSLSVPFLFRGYWFVCRG